MRPLIRKLLPLIGLCWVGMAIAGDVEHKELRCCIPEVNCPTKGGAAGRSGKFMRVSVKAIKDEVTGRVIDILPTGAQQNQYNQLMDEAFGWENDTAFDALIAFIYAPIYVRVMCDGAEVADGLYRHESVLCGLGKGATFEQSDTKCEDPATGTTVILQIEYLSKEELMQELAENDAKIVQNNRKIAELDNSIAKHDQAIADSLNRLGGGNNHNRSGNSSTTETNNYENPPLNNSSASWSWKHWLKHLPVSISVASGGDLGAWQNSGVGLAE